jgi:type 1 glutamine amidotransferase
MKFSLIVACIIITSISVSCKSKIINKKNTSKSKLKVLIIDGGSSHGIWPKTTFMMKDYLEETGLFQVDINRKAFTWIGPHHDAVVGVEDINELLNLYPLKDGIKRIAVDSAKYDPDFNPKFKDYDLVVSNLGWKTSEWPEKTKTAFINYVKEGGGFVLVHGANNAWGEWKEYNKMIGLGAWGDRDEKSGPYIFYNDNNQIEKDSSDGIAGSHGPKYEFQLQTRASEHPIMKGLPELWLHSKDELYDRMRGPGKNMTILATAYSDVKENAPPWDKNVKGTGRHEPMLMTINYGKGRVFHSTLGHMDYSFECVGFITTFQRGSEWAATGKVTQEVPKDFPTSESVIIRKWNK